LQVARTKFVQNYCWNNGGAVALAGSLASFDTVLFDSNVAEPVQSGVGGALFVGVGGEFFRFFYFFRF
jgi:hypothetical protein